MHHNNHDREWQQLFMEYKALHNLIQYLLFALWLQKLILINRTYARVCNIQFNIRYVYKYVRLC